MASKARTEAACLKSVTAKVDWGSLGRIEAKVRSVIPMTPERREQIERDWNA